MAGPQPQHSLPRADPPRQSRAPPVPHWGGNSAAVWGHSLLADCNLSCLNKGCNPRATSLWWNPDLCRDESWGKKRASPKRPSRKSKCPNHRTSLNLKETFHLLVSPKQQLHLPPADLTKQPHFFSCTHQKHGRMPRSCLEWGKEVPATSLGSCCSQTLTPGKCQCKLCVCGIAGGESTSLHVLGRNCTGSHVCATEF